MPKGIIIIIFFFTVRAFGQISKEPSYPEGFGITKLDSLSSRDVLGEIYSSDGFAGFVTKLDSTMTFKTTNFTCMSSSEIDSGSWSIENRNTVVLKSRAKVLRLDILKFDNYYFFIDQSERKKFINDLLKKREYVRESESLKVDNKKHSENYFIWYFLKREYYTREIDLKAGI